MEEVRNLCTPESARKIMGKNFISLEATASVFPSKIKDLVGYETIPYSRELLYQCSDDPGHPFILFPGLQYFGQNRSVTIDNIRRNFTTLSKFFQPAEFFVNFSNVSSLQNQICLPRWYLISKKVLTDKESTCFFADSELGLIWRSERAIVYIYAWVLMRILRGEHLFRESPLACRDNYPGSTVLRLALDFTKKSVRARHWTRNASAPIPDCAPSVNPYGKPNSEYVE